MEDSFFLAVVEATPLQDLRSKVLQNAQYTILCAQQPNPQKRIHVLLDRIRTASQMNALQYLLFLVNTCIESGEKLSPDFIENMVESLIKEAKQHSSWPSFLKWILSLICYFCTDDGTICVFYEFSAPHIAVAALKNYFDYHHLAFASCVLLTHFTLFEVENCVFELARVIQTYPENMNMCFYAVQALAGFTKYDKEFSDRYIEACEDFAEAKGIDSLGNILMVHVPDFLDAAAPVNSDDGKTSEAEIADAESKLSQLFFYAASVAANVYNAGVLEELGSDNSGDFSSGDGVGSSGAKGHNDEDQLRNPDSCSSDLSTLKEEKGEGEPTSLTDPGNSVLVQQLVKLLDRRMESSLWESFVIQVFQVLVHIPHSPYIRWDRVAAIFRSSNSENVLTWAIQLFLSVSINAKELKKTLFNEGCVPRVLEVMKLFPENEKLQEVACFLLSYLSFDSEEITECITEHSGILLVTEAMKKFFTNESLLMSACAALSGLSFHNKDGQDEILQHGGVRLILDAMRSGKAARLQENGCLAIGTMCWNNELKAEVVRLGGIKVLTKTLEDHFTNAAVVKNAFRALAQVAFNCEKYRVELSTDGIIPLIIRGMEYHQSYDRVQMHGCVALSYLSWTNQGNANQITAHRGYQVIVEAMRNHSHNHEVQEHAARALANINQVSPKDAALALEQVVGAMRRHERCAEVQEEACRAIVTLSLISPRNKDKLHELGAAAAVVAVMKNFPHLQVAQQEACNALAHLAYEHAALNLAATELGGIELLLTAMKNFPDNSKIQLNGCGGLSALAFDNPTAQRQIFDLGGVGLVIRAMKNCERLRMLELGCSALGTLAWNTEIKEQVAIEAVPEIVEAMKVHESSALLQKSTCRAISQFAFNSERNRVLLAELGAIPLIVKAMRLHISTEKLVVHALKALTYLCWENVDVAEKIILENIEEVLQQIVDQYPHSHKVSGEAVHLSKILFRKAAESNSPSIRLVSPPTTSPPMSMIPPTPQTQGYRRSRGNGRSFTAIRDGFVSNVSGTNSYVNSPGGGGSNNQSFTNRSEQEEEQRFRGRGGGGRRGRGGAANAGRKEGDGLERGPHSHSHYSSASPHAFPHTSDAQGSGRRSGQNGNVSSHRDPNIKGEEGKNDRMEGAQDTPRERSGQKAYSTTKGSHNSTTSPHLQDAQPKKDPDDLWDDPSPNSFHGNREWGERNWREKMRK